MQAKERMWWNADRTGLLPEGHKDARILYAAVGDNIPDSAVERFGLKDGSLPKGGVKAKTRGEDKSQSPNEDKSGGLKVDKSGK